MLRAVIGAAQSRGGVIALLVFAALLPAASAIGHGRSLSYSTWRLTDEGARVSVRIPLLELSRLGIPLPLPRAGSNPSAPGTEAVGRYLASHLHLSSAAGSCTPKRAPTSHPSDEGWVLYRWTYVCDASGDREIQTRILLEVAPSHLHFARVVQPGVEGASERILERVLSRAKPRWSIDGTRPVAGANDAGRAVGSSLGAYLALGVEHILTGWDHLAFVLALVLLAGRLGDVARLITGFTIAHSLTLALAVLGWVNPRGAPVEAVIGFSVALIAAENAWLLAGRHRAIPALSFLGLITVAGLAWAGIGQLTILTGLGLAIFSASHFALLARGRDPGLHRVALAFAFGLVHGFGFAGILAEMALPTNRLVTALFGFNLGVELGQLGVVALIWPILVLLRRPAAGAWHLAAAQVLSAAICGVGIYWFVSRSFGPG